VTPNVDLVTAIFAFAPKRLRRAADILNEPHEKPSVRVMRAGIASSLALSLGVATAACSSPGAASATEHPSDGGGNSDVGSAGPFDAGDDSDAAAEAGPTVCNLPSSFRWTTGGPIITAIPDATHPIVSVKDPSVVFFNGQWHVYATTADTQGDWSLVYITFSDWSQAASAPQYYMNQNPYFVGYHAAPQLFFFAPQGKWYLIFQSGQPQFSTNSDPGKPQAWTPPRDFFAGTPVATWLDFWVICDDANCYLFFSGDDGNFYRSQTTIQNFPNGMNDPVIVMSDPNKYNLFEGSATYRIKGANKYLTLIEAQGADGHRFYRSFVADRLDGDWTPLADRETGPFAGLSNVTFSPRSSAWTLDISHGEMIRDGYDQTLTVDPCSLRFLYQGVDPSMTNVAYSQLPWQLGLLDAGP
jgi:hypothetical protein